MFGALFWTRIHRSGAVMIRAHLTAIRNVRNHTWVKHRNTQARRAL
jgi:hypothetical protein